MDASPPALLSRSLEPVVRRSLAHFRAVVLNGPRQAGKSTLSRHIADSLGGRYVTLDSESSLAQARRDPQGFLAAPGLLVIDEAQRGGDRLLRGVKLAVDTNRSPGQFLLTGSTRFLTDPTISESLAGRVDMLELRTLSQGEIAGRRESFIDRVFSRASALRAVAADAVSRQSYIERACAGGFPAAFRMDEPVRSRWLDAWTRTITRRDAAELLKVRDPASLQRLVRLLGARTAQELNVADLSRDLGAPRTTVLTHLELLETLHVIDLLPGWSRNLTSKVTKHPKVHITDSGLAARIMHVSPGSLGGLLAPAAGALMETFVAGEIRKQREWAGVRADMHHFRDRDGLEVDLLLESDDGRVAAIEVKAASTVHAEDVRPIERLRDKLGHEFAHGVVLYAGTEVLPWGDRITAMPISALWAQ